jgi:hypothetical protein
MVGGGGVSLPSWISYNMCVPTIRYNIYWKKEYPLFPIQHALLTREIDEMKLFISLLEMKQVGEIINFYNL